MGWYFKISKKTFYKLGNMKKKIILLSGEGLGNTVQLLPLIRTLTEVLGYTVDFCHLFGSYSLDNFKLPYVNKQLTTTELSVLDPNDYEGKIATFWAATFLVCASRAIRRSDDQKSLFEIDQGILRSQGQQSLLATVGGAMCDFL